MRRQGRPPARRGSGGGAADRYCPVDRGPVGEIAALNRTTPSRRRVIVIDPIIGAVIESSRRIELGPPKTAESARTITLTHVAAEVDTRLLDGLQDRWFKAIADSSVQPERSEPSA
jgi:hypothetical protein